MFANETFELPLLVNDDLIEIEWNHPIINCIDCQNPIVQLLESDEFEVTLTDENGCSINTSIQVEVEESDKIFIPNIFSPNNDQVNDFFNIFLNKNIVKINQFLIFDRWGELVFEANGIQTSDTFLGWDGNLKGQPLNPGVFVYYIVLEQSDGIELIKMGDLLLLR